MPRIDRIRRVSPETKAEPLSMLCRIRHNVDYAEEKQMPKSRGIFLLGKEMHKAASA